MLKDAVAHRNSTAASAGFARRHEKTILILRQVMLSDMIGRQDACRFTRYDGARAPRRNGFS